MVPRPEHRCTQCGQFTRLWKNDASRPLIFGVGSVVGMSLVSVCIALPLRLSKYRAFRAEWLMVAAAATSLVVGAGILFRAGTSLGVG
jgi:hypothetical protein